MIGRLWLNKIRHSHRFVAVVIQILIKFKLFIGAYWIELVLLIFLGRTAIFLFAFDRKNRSVLLVYYGLVYI